MNLKNKFVKWFAQMKMSSRQLIILIWNLEKRLHWRCKFWKSQLVDNKEATGKHEMAKRGSIE